VRLLRALARWFQAFLNWMGGFVRTLDDIVKDVDFASNRTFGGRMERVGVSRHTVTAVVIPALLTGLLVNGPAPHLSMRLAVAIGAGLASLVVFASALRVGQRRKWPMAADLLVQFGVLALVAGAVALVADPLARERDASALVYRHVLLAAVPLTGIALLLAAAWSAALFRTARARADAAKRLTMVELFAPPPPKPEITPSMLGVAIVASVVSNPARVLIFPSLAALVFMEGDFVVWGFGILLGLNWLVLAFANLDPAFDASWTLLQRLLLRGGAALVSFLVIGITLAWLFDVQYVSTVLDGARGWTIGGYILTAYALSWWWEYWAATLIAIRFLSVLSGTDRVSRLSIDYAVDPTVAHDGFPHDKRIIQSHGAGRVVVLYSEGNRTFTAYEARALVDALTQGLRTNDPLRTELDWIRWRLYTDQLIATIIAVAVFGGAIWLNHNREQTAQITSVVTPARDLLGLVDTLLPDTPCDPTQPMIVVAASGGGTRAAVYTASVLERLHLQDRLQHVRLVSGVSGGGAALAWFARNRDALLKKDDAGRAAWNRFFTDMRAPYIEHVIDGAGEWRIVTNDRLGRLLAESFDATWGTTGVTLRDIRGVGFMLNSALAGRVVYRPEYPRGQTLAAIEHADSNRGLSDIGGGRLVFTNLDIPDHFDGPSLLDGPDRLETRDARLPVFVMNGPGIALSSATAANANFPPVFPNTAVDRLEREPQVRFWATDGGAIDNRGTETLLLAVRYALQRTAGRACQALPPIDVVEIEASAFSDGYQQDRGVGSVLSAGTAFASQLGAEVLADIRAIYAARETPSQVRFHFLPMPALLRRPGSFGTHWMMQRRVVVCKTPPACDDPLTLTADDVISVLRESTTAAARTPEADEALAAIANEEPRRAAAWNRLNACLADQPTADQRLLCVPPPAPAQPGVRPGD
jgi:hypothetical protein